MRRRALLATTVATATAPLAGCPAPPWGADPDHLDGAELTVRREHTGEFESDERGPQDTAELRRALDGDPPRITVRGRLLAGSRECYRVALVGAELTDSGLLLRLTTEDDPDWDESGCSDVGADHPYEVAVAFVEASVPERVEVRHGDETVLDRRV